MSSLPQDQAARVHARAPVLVVDNARPAGRSGAERPQAVRAHDRRLVHRGAPERERMAVPGDMADAPADRQRGGRP